MLRNRFKRVRSYPSPATDPLLKVIEVQEELIKNLQKQIKELEGAKAESKERHTKKREPLKTHHQTE